MSIINDALKKTQSDLLTKALKPQTPEKKDSLPRENILPIRPPEPSVAKPTSLPQKTKKPALDKTQQLLILIITLCVGLLFGMIFLFQRISASHLPTAKQIEPTAPEGIVINGIMVRDQKNVALINNEIYEAGETVKGMKIVAITLDRVEILVNGEVKSFSVHKK